jgi:lactoylglutathione lyase
MKIMLCAIGIAAAGAIPSAFAQPAQSAPAHASQGEAQPALSLSFVKLAVADLDLMTSFYERAFQLQVAVRIDRPEVTEVGLAGPNRVQLVLVLRRGAAPPPLGGAIGPIGFFVDDVDGAYRKALAAGAKSRREPANYGASRAAFLLDPEGHEIELAHLP